MLFVNRFLNRPYFVYHRDYIMETTLLICILLTCAVATQSVPPTIQGLQFFYICTQPCFALIQWRFSTAWYGTVRYGSLLGGFPLGTVPGTWYFFSTTSVEVPSEPYRYQNVTCKLCWSLIGRRKSSLLRHWTCDTRPSSTARPARFKSAQPAKDQAQLLFKQTHIFASTTK